MQFSFFEKDSFLLTSSTQSQLAMLYLPAGSKPTSYVAFFQGLEKNILEILCYKLIRKNRKYCSENPRFSIVFLILFNLTNLIQFQRKRSPVHSAPWHRHQVVIIELVFVTFMHVLHEFGFFLPCKRSEVTYME